MDPCRSMMGPITKAIGRLSNVESAMGFVVVVLAIVGNCWYNCHCLKFYSSELNIVNFVFCSCWLSFERHFTWAFVGPVLLVCLVSGHLTRKSRGTRCKS